MANINRSWKRLLAVGCSHGHLANPQAQATVLKFKRSWRPQVTFELGDFLDTTAFRAGAQGTPDEGTPIAPDYDAGIKWLRRLEATHVCFGNHEDRLFRLRNSPNAIVAHCAGVVLEGIYGVLDDLGAKSRIYDMEQGWFKLGDTLFGHGYMFNEMALRDHAETFGRCVIAHLHKPGVMTGRRLDHPTGYCVGTLSDIPAMSYAKTKRARLSWGHGLVYGEYCDNETRLWLAEEQGGVWHLPK